jgi:hypothetical protein
MKNSRAIFWGGKTGSAMSAARFYSFSYPDLLAMFVA